MELHPLERNAAFCVSRAVEGLCATLASMLAYGVPSLVCFGERRLGKTWATHYIRDSAEHALSVKIGVCVHICQPQGPQMRQPGFWRQFLTSLNHPLLGQSGEVALARIVNRLVEIAAVDPLNRLLVILDEAQYLTTMSFEWLIVLHNLLEKRGVSAFYLLIGQPELMARQREVLEQNARQVYGRFMAQTTQFKGLSAVDELKYCADQLDKKLFWPEGSKISYSEFYRPAAFRHGWRFGSQSEQLWNVFHEHANVRGGGHDRFAGISMQSFVQVAGYLLRNAQEKPFKGDFTVEQMKEAVGHLAYLERASGL